MNASNQFIVPSAIIALGLVLAAALGSWAFYSARALENVLSVTGSAKTHVVSDTVKWTLIISRKVAETQLQNGYALLAADLSKTEAFLSSRGVAEGDISVSQVFVEELYRYDQYAGPREFNLRQNIVVESSDVSGVDAFSKDISALANQGVFVSGNWLEFYISTLPELRVSLLADALKDAKARAESIASASGDVVGSLRAASSGVVQVLAPNSIDVADYGQYDTSSIEKDVQVTVRASFSVR
jgi:hypothetical protein